MTRPETNVLSNLDSPRVQSVEGLLFDYEKLSQHGLTPSQENQFYHQVGTILSGALSDYKQGIDKIYSEPWINKTKLEAINDRFNNAVVGAQKINFPPEVIEVLSTRFIDYSLGESNSIEPLVRFAAADIGLAIGGNVASYAKAKRVAEHHFDAVKKIRDARGDAEFLQSKARAELAEQMLKSLNISANIDITPSVSEDVTVFVRQHAKSIGTAATATVVVAATATSLLLPTGIAQASELTQPYVLPSSQTSETQNINTGIPIGVNLPNDQEGDEITAISFDPSTITNGSPIAPVNVVATPPTAAGAESAPIQADTPKPVESPISVIPSVNINSETHDSAIPMTINETTIVPPNPTTIAPVTAIPQVPTVSPDQAKQTTSVPIALAPETQSDTTPNTNQKSLTPEQKTAQSIMTMVANGTDPMMASTLIRLSFHDKDESATSFSNGKPVYATTNPGLVRNIRNLELTLQDVIKNSGHADVNYDHLSLLTAAVLDAVANDQTVLYAAEVQNMVASIKRPDDPYQARLFDQYAAKAKELLTADNNALLTGIDAQYQPQIETLYTYVLLANVSDTDQGAQIQVMKDADAKAAAEAAAKAAADAAAAEAAKNPNTNTPEAEAIANLISRETDPVKKNEYIALQFYMAKGLKDYQAAGIVGNFLIESANTMDPTIEQRGGPAKYIPEWEGKRLADYKAYAASKGKDPTDYITQLEYVWIELHTTRSWAMKSLMAAQDEYHAARAFEEDFETPFVSFHGTTAQKDAMAKLRADAGLPSLAAHQAEVGVVNAARAAEAERQANMGMNLAEAKAFVASYKNSPDSIKYIGESGTHCNGGPLSNCTSFSIYFVNKYTKLGGMVTGMPGNGSTVVANILARNPGLETGHVARPNAIFSTPSGTQMCGPVKCGHTGVILGVDTARGVVIVGEAGCGAASVWDTAREYPLAQFDSNAYTYAYTDKYLNGPVK